MSGTNLAGFIISLSLATALAVLMTVSRSRSATRFFERIARDIGARPIVFVGTYPFIQRFLNRIAVAAKGPFAAFPTMAEALPTLDRATVLVWYLRPKDSVVPAIDTLSHVVGSTILLLTKAQAAEMEQAISLPQVSYVTFPFAFKTLVECIVEQTRRQDGNQKLAEEPRRA